MSGESVNMLLNRILTAVIGVPLIFICIYCGNVAFYIMMFIISFLCVYECLTILKKYNPHTIVSLIMASLFFVFIYFFNSTMIDKVAFSAIIMIFILFFVEVVFCENPSFSIERIAISFFGAFFIPLALLYMSYIRNLDNGMKFIFFLFIVVWVLDTAAYGFGILFGQHELAKDISPKKTIEGTIAGIVFGILTAYLCRYVFMQDVLTITESLMLGFVIAIIGQFSDLAESLIKRDANIKDSGKIIPGHGGVFDRFDSYIFVAPTVYYYILLFLK